MPIRPSTYQPPFFLPGGHLQTIAPSLFRRVHGVRYRRERIDTPDGDFLDLDWHEPRASDPARARLPHDAMRPDAAAGEAPEPPRLAILCHGLEGDSRRGYMTGMARALGLAGWDVLAWNYRGCSGVPNRLLRSYHSGATEDLEVVVRHALSLGRFDRIALVGFSLGGNLVLKYLGERSDAVDAHIAGAVAFSAPCDLRASADRLARADAAIYMRRFIVSLGAKLRAKAAMFPGRIDLAPLDGMRTFHQFDNDYTAPLHGFRDAADYWDRSSSVGYLAGLRVPALLISARNDPFLAGLCFPEEAARRNSMLTLEMPAAGGHVGFPSCGDDGYYWSERRAVEFLGEVVR